MRVLAVAWYEVVVEKVTGGVVCNRNVSGNVVWVKLDVYGR